MDRQHPMDIQLLRLLPIASAEGPSYAGLVFYVALVLLAIFVLTGMAKKGFKDRVFTNKLSQHAEQMYLFVESLCINIIGPHGKKYIPFIGTIWLFIFTSNSLALFFPTAPTADFSFNLALALIAVFYVQFEGIKGHADHLLHEGKGAFGAWIGGFFRHMRHFAGPTMGRNGAIEVAVAIVMPCLLFPIELVSELMKNVSLSLRLFGNIHGGHVAVESLNHLWAPFAMSGNDVYMPLGGFLLLVKLLTVIVQALVFCLLTCVYIGLVTHHEEPHGEHAEAH